MQTVGQYSTEAILRSSEQQRREAGTIRAVPRWFIAIGARSASSVLAPQATLIDLLLALRASGPFAMAVICRWDSPAPLPLTLRLVPIVTPELGCSRASAALATRWMLWSAGCWGSAALLSPVWCAVSSCNATLACHRFKVHIQFGALNFYDHACSCLFDTAKQPSQHAQRSVHSRANTVAAICSWRQPSCSAAQCSAIAGAKPLTESLTQAPSPDPNFIADIQQGRSYANIGCQPMPACCVK